MTDTCETCRFVDVQQKTHPLPYQWAVEPRTYNVYECRRFSKWGSVSRAHYCGEFQPKKG